MKKTRSQRTLIRRNKNAFYWLIGERTKLQRRTQLQRYTLTVSQDPGFALFEGRDSGILSEMRVRLGIESMQGMRDSEITIRITELKNPIGLLFLPHLFFLFFWAVSWLHFGEKRFGLLD